MKLKNKSILIISPDEWGYLSLSKHNYAKELSKSNTVYFLNPYNSNDKVQENEFGINVINKYVRIRGLSKFPAFLSRFLMRMEVRSILSQIEDNKVDVVWSFDTSRFFYLDLFKSKRSIAHIMDYTEDFNFEKLVKSADVCISVADCITDKMKQHNDKVFKIEHGFMLPNKLSKLKEPIKARKKMKGIYVGNLNIRYIDWQSLFILSNANRNVQFNFYGPLLQETIDSSVFLQQIKKLDNVAFRGYLNAELFQETLNDADFCIVSYLHKEYGRQLDNSHKIIQYLGSGKPVFSSFTYEYRDRNLLCMYQDKDDVIACFQSFIEEGSSYFSEEQNARRVDFAKSNTYAQQVKKIEEIL